MREINVTLGDREFTILEQPIRKSQAWREQANVFLGNYVDVGAADNEVERMERLKVFLAASMDETLELVLSYSPKLAEEREWILENAYERDIVESFYAIFKFAYPVDFLFQRLYQMMNGLPDNPTSMNSVAQSGASGQTN